MHFTCLRCNKEYPVTLPRWRCDCGGTLSLGEILPPRDDFPDTSSRGLWRYNKALPILGDVVSIGEEMTPLVSFNYRGIPCMLKLDYLFPTGSYKDRGISVEVSALRSWNVPFVVEDSSGNAGSSMAAYCAKAGIKCDIYVPVSTSKGKLAQIEMYGANLMKIPGSREDTALAALHAGELTFYASHNYSPFFEHGVKTYVYEIWEQMGDRLPDCIVAPCGNGSLITSAYLAASELVGAGFAEKIPRLIAVQSESCAPLALAWESGLDAPVTIQKGETAAEGIASASPVKGKEIIASVRSSGGAFVTVSDQEVYSALAYATRRGVLMEPTSATAVAGLYKAASLGFIQPGETVVAEITGNGLKAMDKISKLKERFGTLTQ